MTAETAMRNPQSGIRKPLPDRDIPGIEWVENAALGSLNSMGLRARTRLLVTATTEKGLVRFLKWAKEAEEKFVVLGGGTNVIFADEILDRVILRLGGEFTEFVVEGDRITAGAAVPLTRLVRKACDAGLTGLEGAWHVPGTLGGALAGNAGIPDWAIGDVVEWVQVFDRTAIRRRLAASEITFGYRQSSLAGMVIARARLALQRDPSRSIAKRLGAARIRRSQQPQDGHSAGCIFKNPPGDSAGRLIEAAGLKGLRLGGAVVSRDHANFIINERNATGRDVLDLIAEIRRRVLKRFHVTLETEVLVLGCKGKS